jgi:excisionase family DNA binding protein
LASKARGEAKRTRFDHRWSTDEDLLPSVLERDEAAWREFERRFTTPLRDAVLAATDSPLADDQVDDVVADFWLRLLESDMQSLRTYDARRGTPLVTWLALRISQLAYERVRRQCAEPHTVPLQDIAEVADPRPSLVPDLRRHGPMMRVEDVAKRWDLNAKTVYGMIERGELPARRCGRVLRVPKQVVESVEQGRVVSPGGKHGGTTR